MLLEIAVADAYGAGFEYTSEAFVLAHNNLEGYVRHPRFNIEPGRYTDDTQMSIAIAECLVLKLPWTREIIANSFVTAFQRDPREGYARGFYEFLQEVRNGAEFLTKIRPDSDKSGAAMRATPLGILPRVRDVIKASIVQAAITHNTPDGVNAAIASALMSHYFIYDLGEKEHLGEFIENYVVGEWSQPWKEKVKSQGWMSVRAAITAVVKNNSLSELLQDCVAFTGDVDTVAAIALGAASCSKEYQQDLPRNLLDNLECKGYGKQYLIALDERLMNLKIK